MPSNLGACSALVLGCTNPVVDEFNLKFAPAQRWLAALGVASYPSVRSDGYGFLQINLTNLSDRPVQFDLSQRIGVTSGLSASKGACAPI